MSEYLHQNGKGADGSMAGSYFASQGISLTTVNPVVSGTNIAPPVNNLSVKPL
ncbi:MAG TPA: hypothetical protein VL625_03400 [Patescibacteria group bacterium]|jgi:hypothetical protein|nr:hypothetical protein [Patescibacteria group bacterium]